MDAVGHPVGPQRVVERPPQVVPAQADVERQRLGPLEEPVEVPVEEHGVAAVHPQPLPHPVAEHEPGVEHRHHGLGPGVSAPFTMTRTVSLRGSSS